MNISNLYYGNFLKLLSIVFEHAKRLEEIESCSDSEKNWRASWREMEWRRVRVLEVDRDGYLGYTCTCLGILGTSYEE